jgi:hypothetical protein
MGAPTTPVSLRQILPFRFLLRSFALTVAFLCLSPLAGWSQTSPAEAESPYPYIHSLKVAGNKSISSKIIYSEMTPPRPHLLKWKPRRS